MTQNRSGIYFAIVAFIILCAPLVRAASPDAVVFFDEKYPTTWITRGAAAEVRDFAMALGFESVDAAGLEAWMRGAVKNGAAGTLVLMAQDVAPAGVVDKAPGAGALFRKYLDAGGSVIWIADVPFYFVSSGPKSKEKWDYLGGRGVLGFDTVGNWQGRSETRQSDIGNEWGLQSTWTSVRAVKPNDVTQVLAVDADGGASAWTKEFKKGSLGFIRLWDNNITSFTDTMGNDLYRVAARALPRLAQTQRRGDIYLFQPSEYRPLARISRGGAIREALVSVFDTGAAPDTRAALHIKHDGKILETISLYEGARIFYRQNLELPLLFTDQELELVLSADGADNVLQSVTLAEPPLLADFKVSAQPRINPIDLGRALVPNDSVIIANGQKLQIDFQLFFAGKGGKQNVSVRARVVDRDGNEHLAMSYENAAAEGEVVTQQLETPTDKLNPGKYRLEITCEQNGQTLCSQKWWLLREDITPAHRNFGAFYTELKYDGGVPIYDIPTEKWSFEKWDKLWERGPSEDIVVAFPNGNRFVFWRGSSNVPFWASPANIGLTYEWMEASWGRGGLTDCIEPLQDKKCQYSRPHIISSTPVRAAIDWRYALIDLNYIIADDEWGEETYTFYPDGFGVRHGVGHFLPMTWHEANEFIVFIPADINPFDALPPDAVKILSPDSDKTETITYPAPHGKWDSDTPAIFRINWSREDKSTPIMVSWKFKNFIVQYDGWKVDGRYISPSYWGVHYPVTRGYPTTRGAPPGWRERPGHASLTAVDTEPLSRRMVNQQHERLEWAWLIGNTDMSDDALRAAARSWIDPVPIEIYEGGRGGAYDKKQRGYVVKSDGARTVKVKFKGAGSGTIFNPVLIIENYPYEKIEVLVDGEKPAVYQAALEQSYTQDVLAVWIGVPVKDNAVIRVRPSEGKTF